jgi:hypothetical protein
MTTFLDPSMAPGQKAFFYPWPYVEGLTMAEATNELAFIATGIYGKPMPKQNGAPLRLAVPWKYGFKSVKSIVSLEFTEKRPKTYWESIQESEYGFWANVNPSIPHPRWSQEFERVLGTNERVPTKLFNGYGEQVADLYKGCSGPTSGCRPSCSTAMASRSPIFTKAWRRNASGPEVRGPLPNGRHGFLTSKKNGRTRGSGQLNREASRLGDVGSRRTLPWAGCPGAR